MKVDLTEKEIRALLGLKGEHWADPNWDHISSAGRKLNAALPPKMVKIEFTREELEVLLQVWRRRPLTTDYPTVTFVSSKLERAFGVDQNES